MKLYHVPVNFPAVVMYFHIIITVWLQKKKKQPNKTVNNLTSLLFFLLFVFVFQK